MERTIYALLVGIDDYPLPIPKLQGCVNDIGELKQYLHARVDPGHRALEEALKIKTLIDGEATRDAVIHAFRNHLGHAGPDDVVLFGYSGHGSQQQSPEQFWNIEPDHLDETLVLHDSRSEGSWDLADKELSKLITEVSKRGAHVVVLLDCCHSGSGTRAPGVSVTAVRRAPTDLRQRSLESFIFTLDELSEVGSTRDLRTSPSGWEGTGRHVLLAACRDDEEAKEYQGGDTTRGAFSYFLGETLRTVGGAITYRDLFARAAALVQGQVQRQSPQLEATVSEDLLRPFLGGAIRQAPHTFLASHHRGHWVIDAGRMHGIPNPTPDEKTELVLFAFTASDEDLKDPAKGVGKVRVAEVFGTTSRLEIIGPALDAAKGPFKAVITRHATPRLRVRLEGDAQGIRLAEKALATSQFVRTASKGGAADIRLIAQGQQYLIAEADGDLPLVEQISGYTDSAASRAVARLEHIERWKASAKLDNPASSIGSSEVEVEILKEGRALAEPEVRMEYSQADGGQWINPEITIRLKNSGKRTLYVGLLDLPQTFGIFNMLKNVGCQKLEAGQEAFANNGDPIPVTVPDEFWERGVTEIKDVIKVIVSTTPFDARRMEQPDLDLPRSRAADLVERGVTRSPSDLGTLERLMERVQTRHAGQEPTRRIDDWRTFQYAITTVRPLTAQRLSPGNGVTLAGEIRIEPHSALAAAEIRLTSMSVATRAIGALASLPRWLHEDPTVLQAFDLVPTRAARDALNVLELSGVNDSALITRFNPLLITIPRPLGRGERVLPIAFDGEFFLPLGRSEAMGDETRVILERLPRPTEAESRTLGGSIRILFQKVISRAFGTEYDYPILAAAEVGANLTVRYEPDLLAIRARVARANRIALFVHGIIGDTRDMAASLNRARIADYDLILTFDYENLQDPIAETARALKGRLETVGLGPEHGKSLDVIAHSMGGLVSRWFIEREGGNRVVRRLVMLGTPNGGSPWPNVVDWATTALAVGLNELSKIVWPAAVLAGLTQATSTAQITLGEMMADSDFLKDLSRSPDPGPDVSYFLIAGNTSLIQSTSENQERHAKLQRLLARLWSDRTKYDVANLMFGGSNNDIAVSLSSMQNLPEGRQHVCEVEITASDHMSYFRQPQTLNLLSKALL
ncbi:caspase family protein [Mesorhizobium sp. M0047]|uniref:caspase family protein n=1 Tax=Mesorhizobium sp. M0047 TaxID=2956859 RepID=UPI00333738D8